MSHLPRVDGVDIFDLDPVTLTYDFDLDLCDLMTLGQPFSDTRLKTGILFKFLTLVSLTCDLLTCPRYDVLDVCAEF